MRCGASKVNIRKNTRFHHVKGLHDIDSGSRVGLGFRVEDGLRVGNDFEISC